MRPARITFNVAALRACVLFYARTAQPCERGRIDSQRVWRHALLQCVIHANSALQLDNGRRMALLRAPATRGTHGDQTGQKRKVFHVRYLFHQWTIPWRPATWTCTSSPDEHRSSPHSEISPRATVRFWLEVAITRVHIARR